MTIRNKILLSFLCCLSLLTQCKKDNGIVMSPCNSGNRSGSKIGGVSFVAPVNPIDSTAIAPIKSVNGNWVSLIPFAFTQQGSPNLTYNINGQWWGENKTGIIVCTQLAKAQGIKVMLKPQVWIGGGIYTGGFTLTSETDWQTFEQKYEGYIIYMAELADSLNIEMLCIGTEFETFVQNRPAFWSGLVDSVRKVYTGKLTYSDNWDSYKSFPVWSKLDYIGIDAYFPLSSSVTPTVDELVAAWEPIFSALNSFSSSQNKPILFTEYGYRSIDKCAEKPWDSNVTGNINLTAQSIAYEALYRKLWNETWFAGGFLWKWYDDPNSGGATNKDYTPQNKPVETVIKAWYAK